MQQPTHHNTDGEAASESRICDRALPVATYTRTVGARAAGVRWPVRNPSELLQFWRLTRRLELRRSHGRLLIDGMSYWK